MTTIVTRAGKGSPLTHTEVDTNFTNLNTAKLETAAIPLGTLQAPSVSFLNDSDTGIFCPQGGNSLAIATGGQYAITCSSTQAVGIKTANPQKALHVAGPTRVGADDATDAFLEIGEGATGNRNSYIDIVADTTYTDYGLRVIRNNTGANATSELKHRGTGALNFTTQEAAPIVFNTTNSPRMTILAGGNVGIGTSSPGSLLSVSSSSTTAYSATAFNNSKLYLLGGSATGAYNSIGFTNQAQSEGLIGFVQNASGYGDFVVQSYTGSYAEKLRITSAGLVGIGTAGPVAKLQVDGTTTITSGPGNSTANGLHLYFASNVGVISGFNDGVDYRDVMLEGKNLRFQISGSEKTRIDSSGRLLVGTATSATDNIAGTGYTNIVQILGAATGAGLKVGNTADFARINLVRSANVGTNIELGTLSFGAEANSVERARVSCFSETTGGSGGRGGRLVFCTAPDADATPMERMKISSSGLVSITGELTSSGKIATSVPAAVTSFSAVCTAGDQTATSLTLTSSRADVFYHIQAFNGVTTECFRVEANGNTKNTNNSYGALSDAKIKENIVDATPKLVDLMQVKVRNYNLIGETTKQIGVVAQELESVFPAMVDENADRDENGNLLTTTTKGVKYSVFVPILIKALQEAVVKIESLEARLTAAGI